MDLSIIPSSIVQRVDVVTGGASASWGSDAVSGVVNFIINKNFTGLKATIDLQDTGQDNRRSYGVTVTNGFDLFGGRSHVEWAVTYHDSPQTVFENTEKWFTNQSVVSNPLWVASRAQRAAAGACQRWRPAATCRVADVTSEVRWRAFSSPRRYAGSLSPGQLHQPPAPFTTAPAISATATTSTAAAFCCIGGFGQPVDLRG